MDHLNAIDKVKLATALNDYTSVQHRILTTTVPRYTKDDGKYVDNVLSFLKKLETRAEFLLNDFLDLEKVRVIAALPVEMVESLFGLGDQKYDNTKPLVGNEDSSIRVYVDFATKQEFEFRDWDHREQGMEYLLNEFMAEFPGLSIGTLSVTKEIDLNCNDFAPTRQELTRLSIPSLAILYKIFTSRHASGKGSVKWTIVTTENNLLSEDHFRDEPSTYTGGAEEERFQPIGTEDFTPDFIDKLPGNPFSFNDEKYIDVDVDSFLKIEVIPPPMNKADTITVDPRHVPSEYERVVTNFCAKRQLTERSKLWWSSLFYEPIFLYRYPAVGTVAKDRTPLVGSPAKCILNRNFMYPDFSPDKTRVVLASNVRYVTHAFSCDTKLRTCDGEILRCCDSNIRLFLNACIDRFEKWYDGSSKKTHYRMTLSAYRSLYHIFSNHAVINPFSPMSVVETSKRRASTLPVFNLRNKRTKYDS